MSEYQCYEFLAIDEPLSSKQQRELREISTRAEISSTRFWNEYQWGDLKAEPKALLLKYFDVHHYFSNWGTRNLMLRLPKDRVDAARLKPYFSGDAASLEQKGKHVVIQFWSNDDDGDDVPYEEDPSDAGQLAELVPLRSQLLHGDLRAAYLGWLAGADRTTDDGDVEPPVPPGLKDLTGPLEALASLLGIRDSLFTAAAEASPRLAFDDKAARTWLSEQGQAGKDQLLLRAMKDPSLSVGAELLAGFRATEKTDSVKRRTVAQLRTRADQLG